MSDVASPVSLPTAPYRGLEPYRFCDRAIFFEREAEAERLVRLITMYRGSLLYGESGVGKSSLINAGFIPKALAEGLMVERLRVQPRPDQEFVVERISRSDAAKDFLPSVLHPSAEDTRTTLSASEFLAAVRSRAGDNSLLIFDQFEELLTLAAGGNEGSDAVDCQQRILETIVALLQQRDLNRVRSLFVFREDYLAKFDRLFYFCPELPDRFMRLTPPAASTLHRLLRGPFESPLLPHGHWKREISPADALLLEQELRPREPGRAINLSRVQIAALQLWRSDRPAETLARGGVDGLVEGYLNEQLVALRDERPAAESLLALMITRDGTRRVVSESELLDEAGKEGVPVDRARQAVEDLVSGSHLVRRDFNRGTTTYEIVSEFLVPWIRGMKLQRAALKARNAWLRRAAGVLAVAAIVLGAGYYWKYTTLSRDLLVQDAERALAAEQRENAALRDDLRRLQDTLRSTGSERERKLAEALAEKTTALDDQRRVTEQLQKQVAAAAEEIRQERVGRTGDLEQLRALRAEVARLREQVKQLEIPPTAAEAKPAVVSPPVNAEAKPNPDAPPRPQPPADIPLPTYQRPESLQRRESANNVAPAAGRAIVTVVDPYGAPLRDRIEVRVRHAQSNDRREARGLDGHVPIEINGLSNGTYVIEVRPLSYLTKQASLTLTGAGLHRVQVPVALDFKKPVSATFPPYDDLDPSLRRVLDVSRVLGQSGRALYEALPDLSKAGLLNLFTKMGAFQVSGGHVWTHVAEVTAIRQDGIRARVNTALLDFVRTAAHAGTQFNSVSQRLDGAPAGFTHAGAFKSIERRGLLQLTFFTGTSAADVVADAEIDESSSGFREALRGTTNPYVIYQILWSEQNLDPMYRLAHSPARQNKD